MKVLHTPESLSKFILSIHDLNIIKPIGSGAFGDVFLGIHLPSKEKVAIKKLHESTLNAHLYLREVEALSVLAHPFLLPFFGFTNVSPFCIVTKFIPNGSLFDALHSNSLKRKLTPTEMSIIAFGIASGMEFLHKKNVMHRDLKPQNILLDGSKLPVICDFGTSRKIEQNTMTGQCGTANYMSPEFIKNEKYDQSVDVYSFGMIIWEMLTGQIPFGDEEVPQVIYSILVGQELEIPEGTPENLVNLINGCKAFNPKERPSFEVIVKGFTDGLLCFPGTDMMKFNDFVNKYNAKFNKGNSEKVIVSSNKRSSRKSLRRESLTVQLAGSYLSALEKYDEKQAVLSLQFFEENLEEIANSKMPIWPKFLKILANSNSELLQKLSITFAQSSLILSSISIIKDLDTYVTPSTLDLFLYIISFHPELISIKMINSIINLVGNHKSSKKAFILLCKILITSPHNSKSLIVSFFKENVKQFANVDGGHLALRTLINEGYIVGNDIIEDFINSNITENIISGYEVAFSISSPSSCFNLLSILGHVVSNDENLRNCALECLFRYAINIQGEALYNLICALITSVLQFQTENALLLLFKIGTNKEQNYILLKPGIIELWLGITPQKAPSFLNLFIILLKNDNLLNYIFSLPITATFLSNVLQYGDNQSLLSVCWIIEMISPSRQFAQYLDDSNVTDILTKKLNETQNAQIIQYVCSGLTQIAVVFYSSSFIDAIEPLLRLISEMDQALPYCLNLLYHISKYNETHKTFIYSKRVSILKKFKGKSKFENISKNIISNIHKSVNNSGIY